MTKLQIFDPWKLPIVNLAMVILSLATTQVGRFEVSLWR